MNRREHAVDALEERGWETIHAEPGQDTQMIHLTMDGLVLDVSDNTIKINDGDIKLVAYMLGDWDTAHHFCLGYWMGIRKAPAGA